jgi:hypothetical protein
MISKQEIDAFFASNAERGLDASKVRLRWEFFLFDHRRAPLDAVVAVLANGGYASVEIWDPDPANDDAELMFLSCELLATATPDFVWTKCQELAALAAQHGIEGFDGFDVSREDGSPLF